VIIRRCPKCHKILIKFYELDLAAKGIVDYEIDCAECGRRYRLKECDIIEEVKVEEKKTK
jgi:hypothetical protein